MGGAIRKALVVHEQNAIPGLANKVLAGVADRVLWRIPRRAQGATLDRQPGSTEIAAIAAPSSATAARSGPLRILVIGGSLGARALNDIVPRALSHVPGGRGRS